MGIKKAAMTALFIMSIGVPVFAEESENTQRQPSSTEVALSPAYLDEVNTERQAQEASDEVARKRHERAVEAFTRIR